MTKGNTGMSAEANQEVEEDFMLTSLVSQQNDLATKITEVED